MKIKIELLDAEQNGHFQHNEYTKEARASVRAVFILNDERILGSKNFRVVCVHPALRTTNHTEWTSESFTMPISVPTTENGTVKGNKTTIIFRAQTPEFYFADGDQITLRVTSAGVDLDETHYFEYKSGRWNAV